MTTLPPYLARQASAYLSSRLAQWRPWQTPEGRAPQRDFLRAAATHRMRSYRGGNQSGKTTALAIDTALRLQGWHPFARRQGPVHGWWSALDWDFGVGAIAWPRLKPWLEPSMISSIAWQRRADPEIPTTVNFKNGSRLEFKSADSGRAKYQSATLDFVCMDEEHPAEIVEEIRMRLLVRSGDLFWGLTPIGRERWVLELERSRECKVVRASTLDAARAGLLPLADVQSLADSLPDRQRKVRILGEHTQLEGLVYPEFSEEVHVVEPRGDRLLTRADEDRYPWPLPPSWPRFAAIDLGYSVPTAVVYGAVDPGDNSLIVERVPYAAGIRASRWGEVLPEVVPVKTLAASMIADPSAADERSELGAKGIPTYAAENAILTGIEAVERFLTLNARPRPRLHLVVHPSEPPRHPAVGRYDAHHLVWEMHGYQYPKQDGAGAAKKDLPVKKDDHACDALRYLVTYLEQRWGGKPSFAFGTASAETRIRRENVWG